jgi:uncharacterized protein (TIGR02996 family)
VSDKKEETVDVVVPAVDQNGTATSALLARWMAQNGETVELDQPILVVETDLISVEVPAPARGTLEIVRNAGDTVYVGTLVARIQNATRVEHRPPPGPPQEPVVTDGGDNKKTKEVTELRLPQMGEGQIEAYVNQWMARSGEVVALDQPIVLVELDKISAEVPAPASGVLEILREVGEVPRVGDLLARILPAGDVGRDPALEERHAALLAQIIEAPHDEGARQVYADFLLEAAAERRGVYPWSAGTTGVRGEYISLCGRPATAELDARRTSLQPLAEGTARDLVRLRAERIHVERGFVCGAIADGAAEAKTLMDLVPLTILGLDSLDEAGAQTLLALPRLEQLRVLAVGPKVSDDALAKVIRSGRLDGVRRLTLRQHPLGQASQRAAARLRLDELSLQQSPIPAGVTAPLLELFATIPDALALQMLAQVMPPAVQVFEAQLRYPGTRMGPTVEEMRAAFGPRFRPTRPGYRWW